MTARDREVMASLRETARAWRWHVRHRLNLFRASGHERGAFDPNLTTAWAIYKRANRLACGGN